ncbi:MAG: hypothetical protein ACR2FH_07935 [Caulobacteraceae bacterium]
MMRPASLCLGLALIAAGARAGETECWFENGALVVPAAFGDIAGDFILDISAPGSQLHVTRALSAGIDAGRARSVLILAGERVDGFGMEVGDLDTRSRGFPTNITGVLGADALAPFVADIDFTPCRIRLRRGVPAARVRGVRLRVERVARIPAVEAAISDGATSRGGLFAIDTASAGMRIAAAALSRDPASGIDPAARQSAPARLRALSLAGRLFEQTPAGPWPDAPAALEGAIGATVWSRLHLRLDLKHGWLWLSSAPGAPDRRQRRRPAH